MKLELNGFRILIDQTSMLLKIAKGNVYICEIPFLEDDKHPKKWTGPELNAVAGMIFSDAVSLAASIILNQDIWHRVPERVRFKRIDVENIIRSSVNLDAGNYVVIE